MKKLLFLLLLGSAFQQSEAGDGEYAVNKIPPGILKDAHVVIRKDEQVIELKGLEKMTIRRRVVMTVLDEKGDKYAFLVHGYDKFTAIESMNGNLYDDAGKKIKTLKKSDIRDESNTSEASFADDSRVKYHSFYHRVYPYTVEYQSEIIQKQTMFFPDWNPLLGEEVAVEQSNILIILPKHYTFRYKLFNCGEPAINNNIENRTEYFWEIKNAAAVIKEYASPGWRKIVAYVVMAPSEFQIEGYKGNMNDWKELGKFQYNLNKGRDALPENIRQKIHQLTDELQSADQKVSVLYEFLQKNTRYISIQLGVGGWRPFEASFVANKAYGDCKALSNFMVALLKEAGILAFYTLIKAGEDEEDIITDFPSRQFNHAITCVPNGKDTIWLECTSQTEVPGYMGEFTGNRHALLITEDGGKLVSTPRYGLKENIKIRKIFGSVSEEGQMIAEVNTQYKAVHRDNIHKIINGLSKEKILEYLKNRIDLPNFDVKKYEHKENRSVLPTVSEALTIVADHYASISGKRIFIAPNLLSKASRNPEPGDERKYEIELNFESTSIDTVEIKIPPGYQPEAIPQDIKLESKFGTYYTSIKVLNDKIIYYRSLEQFSGLFSAIEYNDLVKFYEQLYKADRNQVVLVKKE